MDTPSMPATNMSLNLELLRKKKVALCGQSVTVEQFSVKDDLAAILSLSLKGETVNKKSILIEKMKTALPFVSEEIKPFAEAILQIYQK